ncbi:haloacid dehalogenase-like hydrolase domain-containing protein 2 [Drosophila grimshawi]|uniref:Haloacid dehalogenase-like hydrolase domain-containing protein 2 n=1 Tax=Drosophila grimshawi TaxID=7222 RepID=B4JAK4_DROGR|nr:haloacid dehalogenase-like hydrolase domain-containing protein 2 [Drosophila grimshawi]EDW02790.1 GH10842 [Drosophila grimshawi]
MSIKAALIDLSGTLHVEDDPTPNAPVALQRLRDSGVSVRFVTNTTKDSKSTLFERLSKIGFQLEISEIYSSLSAAATFVLNEKLNPFYLLTSDARKDFPEEDTSRPLDSVVVGLAPNAFDYDHMNKAFNVLLQEKTHKLVAVHQGKYYKRADGLALGPGCFVKGLEYATGSTATIIGKPNRFFFQSALPASLRPEECVMIGDDANDDIAGAMKVGLQGVLVKTGKFLPDALAAMSTPPTAVVTNFSEAVDWVLCKNRS